MVKFATSASLQQWVERIGQAGVPVLQRTIDGLQAQRAREDDADAQSVAAVVLGDPLMTVKALAHVAGFKSRRIDMAEITVDAAVQLLGVPPFLRAFEALTSVEDCLAAHPQALAGVTRALQRSYRAATLALGFAVHRVDLQAASLHQAALLHEFAELLIWCHAPMLALAVESAHAETPADREAVERSTLGVCINELEQALMIAWGLPSRLIRVTDDHHADTPAARTVTLAARIARHTETGWTDPAVYDDLDELGRLLGIMPVVAQRKSLEWLGEAT